VSPTPLLYEACLPGGDEWTPVAVVSSVDRGGSLSDISQGYSDLVLFRCYGSHSVVSRSVGGVDYALEDGGVTGFLPLGGLAELARLRRGASFEMRLVSDRGVAYGARWTHHD
jgi:hypothetical protein